MAERTSYLPGTPCWVDLGTTDTQAAARFYGGLLGWAAAIDSRPEASGYGMFTSRGLNVAGLGPQMGSGPPRWSVYVSVSDLDKTAETIAAKGGKLLAGPMDVFDAGRMAVAQDTAGSFISIWQPGAHIGAQLVNEPGAFTWNELAASDLDQAVEFYTSVFGWGAQTSSEGAQGVTFTLDGNVACGAHAAGPGEFPAWSVWFSVQDCDASAAKAAELGGRVVVAPNDMGFGRGAVVADPQGAVFGIAVATA
ncbi:MAG: VOC family protein [Acidimicrobiales bacterium]